MNLEQLRRRFRVLAKDTVEPFLYADDDIADWLTDAEAQACMRGRLLLDDYTPSVCVVPVVAGTHSYNLHPKLYELVLVRFKATGDTRSDPVRLVSREWMDDNVRDWRDADNWSYTSASRRYAVQSETGLRIVPAPDVAGELLIEGYRLPMRPLANDNDKPEMTKHARALHGMGLKIVATRGTAEYLCAHGVPAETVFKVNEGRPNVVDIIKNGGIRIVFNTPLGGESFYDDSAIRKTATLHNVLVVTTLTATAATVQAIRALRERASDYLSLQEIHAAGA